MSAAILLIDPKYPHNVGQSVRACAAYGVQDLYFTGDRMSSAMKELKRLPREERLRGYRSVQLQHIERPFDRLPSTRLSAKQRRTLWDSVVAMAGIDDPAPNR